MSINFFDIIWDELMKMLQNEAKLWVIIYPLYMIETTVYLFVFFFSSQKIPGKGRQLATAVVSANLQSKHLTSFVSSQEDLILLGLTSTTFRELIALYKILKYIFVLAFGKVYFLKVLTHV